MSNFLRIAWGLIPPFSSFAAASCSVPAVSSTPVFTYPRSSVCSSASVNSATPVSSCWCGRLILSAATVGPVRCIPVHIPCSTVVVHYHPVTVNDGDGSGPYRAINDPGRRDPLHRYYNIAACIGITNRPVYMPGQGAPWTIPYRAAVPRPRGYPYSICWCIYETYAGP